MASALCFAPLASLKATQKPGNSTYSLTNPKHFQLGFVFQSSPSSKLCSAITKAAKNSQSTKPNSVICGDCDGNGAVLCSQCKGSGVNSVDIFNGRFKAGDSCWLCGGKKDMLCGNCNGAGFVGGFMSTFDE
ncbi:Chaperone protein DnaJ-like [Quillaja saponaria]|uniref:Chaperone protein DnaJ-like n=1 Tax=Quillaja saponaria TaxID=32244 RepID=A0AAD7LXK4_QUISA|nr:Chaperone protein DnaJ-like [Quillaja saponaria]